METVLNTRYYVGMVGYGISISDNLNLGVSIGFGLFQRFAKFSSTVRIYQDIPEEMLDTDNTTINTTTINTQLGIGLQLSLGNHKIGLYGQTPTFILYGTKEIKSYKYIANSQDPVSKTGDIRIDKEDDFDFFKVMYPGFVSVGYAFVIPESICISLDITPYFPIKDDDYYDNFVVNFNVGFELFLSDSFVIRTGVFTDFSQKDEMEVETVNNEVENTGQGRFHYYGGSFSISFSKTFTVIEKGEDNKEVREKKTLWTSLGVIMRYGRGKYVKVHFKSDFSQEGILDNKNILNIQAFIAESVSF